MNRDREELQIRATFQDTLKSQKRLREFLDSLEKEDRPIDKKQISEYLDLLANALLGLDYMREFMIKFKNKNVLYTKNLGGLLRSIPYLDNTQCVDKGKLDYTSWMIDPGDVLTYSDLWGTLRNIIFGIYPEAIMISMKISKEQTHFGPSDAGLV